MMFQKKNNDIQKKIIDFYSLCTIVVFVSHIFACLWILIGLTEFELNQQGWIWENSRPAPEGPDIQLLDYWSLYITSIYWIYTTFSSVGYGDVKGFTDNEYLF